MNPTSRRAAAIRRLAGLCLIVRIACRRLPIDWDLALGAWLCRPAIEAVLEPREDRKERQTHLARRLDEVYPF